MSAELSENNLIANKKKTWRTKNYLHIAGHYSLQEPDGSWRIVNYVADEHGKKLIPVQH